MSMFDMDQFMADREASMRRRPLCQEERDVYHSGDPDLNDEDES